MNVVGKDILKVARALGVGSGAAEVSDSGNRATPDTAGPPQLKTKAIFGLGLLSETYPDPYPYTLNWRFEFESKGQPCAQNFFQLLGADTKSGAVLPATVGAVLGTSALYGHQLREQQ